MNIKYPKPPGCARCPIEHQSLGFVPPSGPAVAPIALMGSHVGYDEVAIGLPMVGAAGGMLTRLVNASQWTREQFRIVNGIQCCPPGAEVKKSWYRAAWTHCHQHRTPALQQNPVIVALGGDAIRGILDLWDVPSKHFSVDNFHGTVHSLTTGQQVVCSYHPSHLQRGAHTLFQIVSFDLHVAHEVARGEWQREVITPVIDPPVEWFAAYVEQYLAFAAQHPDEAWLMPDIETLDTRGKSEAELGEDDRSYTILRVNFACNRDEGVTVPWSDPYIPLVKRLTEEAPVTGWWNNGYDLPRLARHGIQPRLSFERRMVLDGMWLCKHLQSDVPMGLGFWAPFYSKHGAWKHLANSTPGEYAAYDGPQTYRTVTGIVQDLIDAGKWDFAYRHSVRLMEHILRPATTIGIQVDRQKLDAFVVDLTEKARLRLHTIQEHVPASLLLLTPPEGYANPPKRDVHAKGTMYTAKGEKKADADDMDPLKLELYAEFSEVVEKVEMREVWQCNLCDALNVLKNHRCDPKRERSLRLVTAGIKRWYWREPFNPDSPTQWLAYMRARGHKPGRNKKTRNDSADRETLQRLARTTKDPVYQLGLDLRSIVKVRSTYGIGVQKRLDEHDRFHPQFTRRPSMFRGSAVAPNIQNVVGDKGGKDSLAAGFRKTVVATAVPPPWWDELTPEQQAEYL
jgi:uracil-DNA glycosylase family 4